MGEYKGFMMYDKGALPEMSLVERLMHHDSFQQRFSRDVAQEQGARCMDCGTPFCQTGQLIQKETVGCPIGNYIPEWNHLVYEGDYYRAYQRLSETNNFPEFTGHVCPAPCEQSCVMKINRESVAIKGIERTIIDEAFEQGWVEVKRPTQRNGQSVAIVGSGPAGLTAADELNQRGYHVTVFERAHEAGGLLMYGIPNMKLDKDVVRRRITLLEEAGIEFITNTEIGVDMTKAELEASYDAVILCTGAQQPRDLPLEGRMGHGIHFAMDYLTTQTQYLAGETDDLNITAKNKHVVVIGSGDTGADCVATALREGCKSVVQFNRRGRLAEVTTFDENTSWPCPLPAFKMDYAHDECVARFGTDPRVYHVASVRYDVDDAGHVKGVYTTRTDVPDNKEEAFGTQTEQYWPADLVLLAIGFVGTERTVPKTFDVRMDQHKVVANDTDYRTNQPHIFAAGDARRGASLVVWAIKEGRGVAQSVHNYLKQKTCV